MKDLKKHLEKIDKVIENGPFSDDWGSLSDFPVPNWLKDSKFGIIVHWGVYSVPAFFNEWYPRQMYMKESVVYKHHIETYGKHKDFPYENFVPMFKGENFNPDEWISLFKKAGAKYVMPVAEHHDGFQMYDSELSEWNAAQKGPKRNVLAEIKDAAEKQGMVFTTSSHRAENFWFYGGANHFDSGIENMKGKEPYGYVDTLHSYSNVEMGHFTRDINHGEVPKEFLEDWLVRTCELVEKYRPKAIWFDWWIQNKSFRPYLKKFAAFYYNMAATWEEQVTIFYKDDAFAYSTAVFDVERGQFSEKKDHFWQTDTAIAKNSWCYTENNDFKKPKDLICDLVDIVSKNGALLLNVGPHADGRICEEEKQVLLKMGQWLEKNGEAIYNTKPWVIFGEGPTAVPEGHFSEDAKNFTKQDIRFTYNAPYLYATFLDWDKDRKMKIVSLKDRSKHFKGDVKSITALGHEDISLRFVKTSTELMIESIGQIESDMPVCLKIEID